MEENSVISILEITAEDGKNYKTQFYRLEAILAVGYRVNSVQATDFRKWATTTLNEFIRFCFPTYNYSHPPHRKPKISLKQNLPPASPH